MAGGMWEFMSLIISKSMLECARAHFWRHQRRQQTVCVCVDGERCMPFAHISLLTFDFDCNKIGIWLHSSPFTFVHFFFVVCIALDVWHTANRRWQNATIKTKALHLKCNFLLRRSQMKWTKILYASSCCCILRSTNFWLSIISFVIEFIEELLIYIPFQCESQRFWAIFGLMLSGVRRTVLVRSSNCKFSCNK